MSPNAEAAAYRLRRALIAITVVILLASMGSR